MQFLLSNLNMFFTLQVRKAGQECFIACRVLGNLDRHAMGVIQLHTYLPIVTVGRPTAAKNT
jgi:hypothetical protein